MKPQGWLLHPSIWRHNAILPFRPFSFQSESLTWLVRVWPWVWGQRVSYYVASYLRLVLGCVFVSVPGALRSEFFALLTFYVLPSSLPFSTSYRVLLTNFTKTVCFPVKNLLSYNICWFSCFWFCLTRYKHLWWDISRWELQTEALWHWVGQHGQCGAWHQWLSVLYHLDQALLVRWQACGIWKSHRWNGNWIYSFFLVPSLMFIMGGLSVIYFHLKMYLLEIHICCPASSKMNKLYMVQHFNC